MDKFIDKYMVNYSQGNIEKHSDSSDFDETTVTFVPSKTKDSRFHMNAIKYVRAPENLSTISCNIPSGKKHVNLNVRVSEEKQIPVRDFDMTTEYNIEKYAYKREITKFNSKGDSDTHHTQSANNSREIRDDPTACLSNIFRHTNTKQNSSMKEIPQDNSNSGKTFCSDCERRRIKKLNRRRRSYVVQPVYAVDGMQEGPVPFGHANDQAPLSQHNHNVTRKQDSDASFELTSSESEIERTDQRKPASRRNFIDRFQKEMRKEYLKYEKELLRNRVQQYPSKRDYHSPYQIYTTPRPAPMKDANSPGTDQSRTPSTSSGFLDYLFEKIRGKQVETKCKCSTSIHQLGTGQQKVPDTFNCGERIGPKSAQKPKAEALECECHPKQTNQIPQCPSNVQPVSKKQDTQNVKCKCPKKKRKELSNNNKEPKHSKQSLCPPSLKPQEDIRPCQEPHDEVTKTLEERYNGEILCIHNPPCVLINGCLNLPNPKEPASGNFWPVTQEKKSIFNHMCRRMKRPKHSYCEQSCQYHPPNIEVQALEVKPEKIIQSVCNHKPPCEVVHGCYKPKYDPKLDNSCVHVPMCERMPECLVGDRRESKSCEHKPKCTEMPLCSRKFLVLTARDTVGTQVRQKTKLVCRHEPPCIMIPKCLARIISENYVPCDALPDCVHQPCCDLIPACCRRVAKDMPILTSVEEGISILPRAPAVHKNRLLRGIRRNKPQTSS